MEQYPHIKTPQGSAPGPTDKDLSSVMWGIVILAVAGAMIGLFIGWLIFAPSGFERTCGTVEECVVRGEQ